MDGFFASIGVSPAALSPLRRAGVVLLTARPGDFERAEARHFGRGLRDCAVAAPRRWFRADAVEEALRAAVAAGGLDALCACGMYTRAAAIMCDAVTPEVALGLFLAGFYIPQLDDDEHARFAAVLEALGGMAGLSLGAMEELTALYADPWFGAAGLAEVYDAFFALLSNSAATG